MGVSPSPGMVHPSAAACCGLSVSTSGSVVAAVRKFGAFCEGFGFSIRLAIWLFRVSGFRQFFGTAEWKRIVKHNMGRISLVVDDEPAVRKFISAILQREHFQTVEAGDGAHGLRIVQELGDEVALIVSDIHMPNGGGVAFAQAVKAEFPAMPIILVSGQAEPHPEFGFVRKPFLPSTLLSAVREVVGDSLRTVPADC